MKQIVIQDYLATLRRCGKGTVMQQFRGYLKSQGVQDRQIVFMNF